jgi:hypothetical protein
MSYDLLCLSVQYSELIYQRHKRRGSGLGKSECTLLFGGHPALNGLFASGYPISRSHIDRFHWHTGRHWGKLPTIPYRDHSSWLDVFALYVVSILI